MNELTAPGEGLLAAIAARDYERIASCFAEDSTFRVLTPGPLREHEGPRQAADRYRYWLEPLEEFQLLAGDVVPIADRIRIRYLFRGRSPEKGWQLNEHTGYAAVEEGRIRALNLTCSGFRPMPEPPRSLSEVASSLTPMLTVKGAAAAIAFYERAFGAEERQRFTTPTGHIVAEMAIGEERFFVVDENPQALNLSPEALGGTSVRLNLIVEDPDASAARAVAAGATEIFPVADQPYAMRQGRVADPYGHHWLLGRPLTGP